MRVMLAEDSILLREGLVRLLAEEGHQVAAAVGDATALVAAVGADPPEAVVVDVRMPPTHTDEGCAPHWRSAAAGPPSGSWCSPSTSRSVTPWSC
ncbi:hypothetical protein GCM10027615_14770 [Plantactinospora veratri]